MKEVSSLSEALLSGRQPEESFRVRVSLERYFRDERAHCYMCVSCARPVSALERRLRHAFALPGPFALISRGHLLPPTEPLGMLQHDDPVEVVPTTWMAYFTSMDEPDCASNASVPAARPAEVGHEPPVASDALEGSGEQLEAPEAEVAALEEQDEVTEAEVAALEEQVEASEAEVAAIEEQLEASEAEVAALEKQLEEQFEASEAEVAALEEQDEATEAEVAALEEQVEASEAEVAAIEEQREASEAEMAALEKQLEEQFEATEAEVAALEEEIAPTSGQEEAESVAGELENLKRRALDMLDEWAPAPRRRRVRRRRRARASAPAPAADIVSIPMPAPVSVRVSLCEWGEESSPVALPAVVRTERAGSRVARLVRALPPPPPPLPPGPPLTDSDVEATKQLQ